MTIGYATTLRNARMDAISSAASSNALVSIYAGTRPATGGASTVVLAQFTMSSSFAPPATSGVLLPNLPAATTGVFASTATWGRLTTSSGVFVADMSVSTAAADIVLNTNVITVGVAVTMTSARITEGNA